MNDALVYSAAALFALFIFPVHIFNYIYINTATKYASLNAGLYKIAFLNVNSVEDKPNEMQINGKNKKIDSVKIKSNAYKIFNSVCLYKIVQLGDYGVQKDGNVYIAFSQNVFSTAIYKYIQINGNYCKLRNYTILNEEHGDIRYYAKAVTIINLFVVAKIFLILLTEKINEFKT